MSKLTDDQMREAWARTFKKSIDAICIGLIILDEFHIPERFSSAINWHTEMEDRWGDDES